MLHLQSIESKTLELLNKLMQFEVFKQLRLVGGTSLALQIGHRLSVDIDLFGTLEVDEFELIKVLNNLGVVTLLNKTQNINIYLINGIKVDLVNYPYPWLEEAKCENKLILAGKKDIAAMKIAAITGRGSKKDFTDLYFLLKEFSLKEILDFYKLKYYDASELMALKSLSYFDDADEEEDPIMLTSFNWSEAKKEITQKLIQYMQNLT
ncbi:MAG TPA: nucleotidyl transferase AbiEii/AbiGii toxin family protein [Bacteroidales bacterium]|nr:nucleotidyl transferase AbiEii/AbiGii toxin family protein [Bacteroidales bacterium]